MGGIVGGAAGADEDFRQAQDLLPGGRADGDAALHQTGQAGEHAEGLRHLADADREVVFHIRQRDAGHAAERGLTSLDADVVGEGTDGLSRVPERGPSGRRGDGAALEDREAAPTQEPQGVGEGPGGVGGVGVRVADDAGRQGLAARLGDAQRLPQCLRTRFGELI